MEVADARLGSRQTCAPPWMRLRSRVAVPSCGAPARTKPARSAARAHELRTGESYTVIVTTGGGLWRHRLGDLVEVDGFFGASVSDLCGDKLAETFATRAIAAACASCACTPHFALLAPEHDPAGRWSDTLFAEGKLPYETPRPPRRRTPREPPLRPLPHLGQLGPVTCVPVTDGYRIFSAASAAPERRLGDIKPQALALRSDWRVRFATNS